MYHGELNNTGGVGMKKREAFKLAKKFIKDHPEIESVSRV
jgi:hypothetical protein